MIDYDTTCASVGVRIQDGDHLVRQATDQYGSCSTWPEVVSLALRLRQAAVTEERYLTALIHDTIRADAQREIENA